ncbi:MAG: hypothetical protein D6698_16560 [Gammaproteobacteria bacterium]|nr:MAG: hypothetical protein D6698_16560 [Gammaproteobacteria bacterium]
MNLSYSYYQGDTNKEHCLESSNFEIVVTENEQGNMEVTHFALRNNIGETLSSLMRRELGLLKSKLENAMSYLDKWSYVETRRASLKIYVRRGTRELSTLWSKYNRDLLPVMLSALVKGFQVLDFQEVAAEIMKEASEEPHWPYVDEEYWQSIGEVVHIPNLGVEANLFHELKELVIGSDRESKIVANLVLDAIRRVVPSKEIETVAGLVCDRIL